MHCVQTCLNPPTNLWQVAWVFVSEWRLERGRVGVKLSITPTTYVGGYMNGGVQLPSLPLHSSSLSRMIPLDWINLFGVHLLNGTYCPLPLTLRAVASCGNGWVTDG